MKVHLVSSLNTLLFMNEPTEKEIGKGIRSGNKGNRQRNEDMSNFVFGKVPPQSVALEEAVLGAIMLDREALPQVLDILQAESFYLDSHQRIYKAMLSLFERSKPIDLLTVVEQLRQQGDLEGAGGAVYMAELTNKIASAANIEFHARILAQKHIQRELIRVSTKTIKEAFEDTTDVFELLDDAEQNLFNIAQKNMGRRVDSMSSLASQVLKQLEELKDNKEGLTGVPTGFTEFDRLTSGLQRSDLFIIAARPGMGKTALTLSLARNTSMLFKKGVAIFSLEMSSLQLAQRIVSMEAEIQGQKLRNGRLEPHEMVQLVAAVERAADAPIFIDDTPQINVFELRAKCRRLKLQHDIQLIIIDYLQLMSGSSTDGRGNREQEVSAISRALKSMAKELEVPVIALSQLSRAVETRGGNKRPQLSDLRESGSIEQDADMVAFIYRPEYYQIMEDEEGQPTKGVAELIVAKNRHGAVKTIRLRFTDELARFSDLDEPDFGALPSDAFDNSFTNIITRPSRMNDDDEVPF